MKRSTKYVFLDVHAATTSGSVREESGRVIARTVVPTEAAALLEFIGSMRGAVHVAFEEGTQAQWLHDLLAPHVAQVVVCNRRGEVRQGNKADRLDADQGSELLRRGALRAVYHGSTHRATLKELARTYRMVVTDSTRIRQRLKALFRARAIPTPGQQLFHPAARAEWLARLSEAGARFRAETLYAEWEVVRALRPKVKAALLSEAARDPAWAVLCRVPQLGPVRVALLLAVLQTPWRFRTKRHLWAHGKETTMRKKPTAPPPQQHPEASSTQRSGLIAKAPTPLESVRGETVLDNLSHRTTRREFLTQTAAAASLGAAVAAAACATGPGIAAPRHQ